MNPGIRSVLTERFSREGAHESADDDVVVEEPLEVRIDGETLATTMRTPGHDRELVLGFLVSEGIIASRADVSSVSHCGRPDQDTGKNTIDVRLISGVKVPVDPETGLLVRRGTLTTSSCGVCGRRSVIDLIERVLPIAQGKGPIRRELLLEAVRKLSERQPIFQRTGGCHAALLFDFEGRLLASYEDVGRHNAVDKLVGSRLLAGGLPCKDTVLAVSGRSSFEIVQKAFAAGIAIVASVSAPSSLAVELAQKANITLACFVRETSMTVYAGKERIAG